MPVTVLLCEGARDSPDARVLNNLLAGYCTVQPIGSQRRTAETKDLLRQPAWD